MLIIVLTAGLVASCGSTDQRATDAAAGDGSLPPTSGPTDDAPSTTTADSGEPAGAPDGSDDPVGPLPTIPALAPTPEALAEQLARAEAVIRDPASSDHDVAAQARLQQLVYRVVAERPTWQEPVVAALPDSLRPAARLHLQARAEFRSMHVNPPTHVPSWRIVPPAPADELLGYYEAAEAEFGIAWPYLAAINLVETGMGRIRGDSSAGAQGPMQFIPSTWERFGQGDVMDPEDAILAAARYLAHNGGADGRMDDALFRYNNDVRYVRGVTAYARIMEEDPATYRGFHQWQVWYASAAGDLVLPEGYHLTERQPAEQYAADNPDRHRPYSP